MDFMVYREGALIPQDSLLPPKVILRFSLGSYTFHNGPLCAMKGSWLLDIRQLSIVRTLNLGVTRI